MLINIPVYRIVIFEKNLNMDKIVIGSDHAGFELKEELIKYLCDQDYDVIDKGTYSKERTDYPDYAHAVANAVVTDDGELGILICGSGNGIAMAANKHTGIRCAICWDKEISKLARAHNNANVLALPARFISTDQAKEILDVFLSTEFEGGRHSGRVEKIGLV